jgi:hypothetical protein
MLRFAPFLDTLRAIGILLGVRQSDRENDRVPAGQFNVLAAVLLGLALFDQPPKAQLFLMRTPKRAERNRRDRV